METALLAGTIASYLALSLGMLIQRGRIIKRGSSADISLWEVMLRAGISVFLLVKFIAIGDVALIGGQLAFLVCFACNIIVVFRYHGNGRQHPPG